MSSINASEVGEPITSVSMKQASSDNADPSHQYDVPGCCGFTPRFMLAIFCTVNLFTYMDRGVMASVLDDLGEPDSYGINKFQEGVLAAMYMIGYTISSPLFAHYAHRFQPLKMMTVGLLIWCLSTLGCGLSIEFYTLAVARAFTGVGEASFLCLSPPFIDRFAPPAKKAQWLAMFFTAIPVGYAIGYIIAGEWLGFHVFGKSVNWRIPFIFEALVMLPFALTVLFVHGFPFSSKDIEEDVGHGATSTTTQSVSSSDQAFNAKNPNHVEQTLATSLPPSSSSTVVPSSDDTVALLSSPPSVSSSLDTTSESVAANRPQNQSLTVANTTLKQEIIFLFSSPIYVSLVFGYAAQTFVVGSFAFYGIQYVHNQLHIESNMAFGALTVICGLVGTFAGGFLLDRVRRVSTDLKISVKLALKWIFILSCVAVPLGVFPFSLFTSEVPFFLLLGACELCLFACIAPINSAILWSIPTRYGGLAIAMSVLIIHAFGDAVSPPILGALLVRTNDDWVFCMFLLTLWLLWSVLIFGIGYWWASRVTNRISQNKPLLGIEESIVDMSGNGDSVPSSFSSFSTTAPSSSTNNNNTAIAITQPLLHSDANDETSVHLLALSNVSSNSLLSSTAPMSNNTSRVSVHSYSSQSLTGPLLNLNASSSILSSNLSLSSTFAVSSSSPVTDDFTS
eukprot:TRINITY_DN1950_c0_g1_i1.p1 TRINITY_DN1950_c0_g1~~TRINITY_DN1950_c0_g1_i1.p1  ORF type:complete len:678 (-),score=153.87 TRINITY_DN1950_c0_g1_i1:44-2077(-)